MPARAGSTSSRKKEVACLGDPRHRTGDDPSELERGCISQQGGPGLEHAQIIDDPWAHGAFCVGRNALCKTDTPEPVDIDSRLCSCFLVRKAVFATANQFTDHRVQRRPIAKRTCDLGGRRATFPKPLRHRLTLLNA
jgi:hypothetical protein